ncbi:MAG TPA: hypothetical protein VG452_03280 [Egibacteraceae bacterium]|nr:hypothetical protein [Egibacteraceae bacterium]
MIGDDADDMSPADPPGAQAAVLQLSREVPAAVFADMLKAP